LLRHLESGFGVKMKAWIHPALY